VGDHIFFGVSVGAFTVSTITCFYVSVADRSAMALPCVVDCVFFWHVFNVKGIECEQKTFVEDEGGEGNKEDDCSFFIE
jgi:hypothetical protein